MDSAAKVAIDRNGVVTVSTDMTDIGTGSYTVIAQTAAEMMGVPLEKVVVQLGDSDFPISSGSGGQWGGNSSTSPASTRPARSCARQVAKKLGVHPDDARFADGHVRLGDRQLALGEVARRRGAVRRGRHRLRQAAKTYAAGDVRRPLRGSRRRQPRHGEVRVRRMSGVFAAGRILNPKTARSQVIGAMTMGLGAALMEESIVDPRYGYFVNHDLAELSRRRRMRTYPASRTSCSSTRSMTSRRR